MTFSLNDKGRTKRTLTSSSYYPFTNIEELISNLRSIIPRSSSVSVFPFDTISHRGFQEPSSRIKTGQDHKGAFHSEWSVNTN